MSDYPIVLGANGARYAVEVVPDDNQEAPWSMCDGHGPVRRTSNDPTQDIHAGEVVLHDGGWREYSYLYNRAEAIKIAVRDGWNAGPDYNAPNQATRAVEADMEYLRSWCAGEWHYVVVVVFPLTAGGDELRSKSQSLGGIESTDAEGIDQAVCELIAEIEAE